MTLEARFQSTIGEFHLDIELNAPLAGVTSLFGPSGCGKTTLLRAIAGLDRHPGGYLRVGDSIWQDNRHFIPAHRRSLGYVFQESSLFDHLNVLRNLEYGARRANRGKPQPALDRAIELLEISSLLKRMPATLSGGERQRVAIARALAVAPQLLLMDEPLAAVDLARKQEIIPYLESLQRELDIPMIHVSHLPDEVARLADRVVLMEAGKITATGDVHEIFTRLDLPLSQGADAASVIDAVVESHDTEYQLTRLTFDGGNITMAGIHLAEGSEARLLLAARDVSLTLERQAGTSILNIIPVEIDNVSPGPGAQISVRLFASKTPLLATITRKSAEDLQLQPGKLVFAQIKSVALLP